VQTHAVHALADLPSKEGLPYLIRVAKTHANREVRKAAIYSLGDMNDPAAIQALVDIVKGKL
jgi:HEAT repeat protein